ARIPLVIISLLLLYGCAGDSRVPPIAGHCSGISADSLAHYDSVSQQSLSEAVSHPDTNAGGNIIWGTRYYMESLLDAYDSTGNPKYIGAFVDTGTTVMNGVKSLTVLNV